MKASGIICEYNPFHNGHKYHIDMTKQILGQPVIAVMSGNFVQRGESALFDKSLRVKTALDNGCDLVLELPLPWAVSSAEGFAYGGISVLEAAGIVDTLSFGSESADAHAFDTVSDILLSDKTEKLITEYLSGGISYPSAREKAVNDIAEHDYSSFLSSSNDLLGIEYAKAIKTTGSGMNILPVKRFGAEHDSDITSESITSASQIRKMIKCGDCSYRSFIPGYDFASDEISDMKYLEKAVMYRLRCMTAGDFAKLPDVSEGLEYRLYDAARTALSVEDLCMSVKTKRYTLSRIRRIVLYALLGIEKNYAKMRPPYIRVLGFNDTGRMLLREMKNSASLPVVMKYSDLEPLGETAKEIFSLEARASDIFNLSKEKTVRCGTEQKREVIYIRNQL